MARLLILSLWAALLGIAVFFDQRALTPAIRWQLLRTPTPDSNSYLPAEVIESGTCLRKLGVPTFRIFGFEEGGLHYQRFAEGLWPIRLDSTSDVVVTKRGEIACDRFEKKCEEGAIVVGICPI